MFRRLNENAGSVMLEVDGMAVTAAPGDTVAAAMLAAGISAFGTAPVDGAPRGPYCLMGVCFGCLVRIDGEPDRRACMELVRDGMRIVGSAGAAGWAP